MKMTPRYTTFRGPSGGAATSMNLKPGGSQMKMEPSSDDDEFSDFKSGLPISPGQFPPRITSHAPLLSTNLLSGYSPTHQPTPRPNEVGSRLANYNLGFGNHQSKMESLIGDEDKYSPLRAFLQNESSENTEGDGDFGDFQSFTQVNNIKEDHLAVVPTRNIPPSSLITPLISTTYQNTFSKRMSNLSATSKITVESQVISSGNDDFGDFVSCDARAAAPPTIIPTKSTSLDLDLLNFEISSQPTKTKTPITTDLSSSSSSLMPEFDLSRSFHPEGLAPLKTTLITGPSPTEQDPFGDFLSSTSLVGGASASASADDLTQIHSLKKCTPETMSVSSLELGNYSTYTWEGAENGLKATGKVIPKEGPRSSPLLAEESDKYGVIKEEQEREIQSCVADWRRVLETCLRLIEDGERLFQSVSSSHIIHQIIQSDKGRDYFLSLRQVYLVGCRVYQSWMRFGGNDILSELHQRLALAWDSMSPFLLGTKLEDDFRRRSPVAEGSGSVCGICLVGTGWRDGEDEESWRLSLDFGGTLYHLPCANLWINQVNSLLPTLNTLIKTKKQTALHLQTLI